MTDLTQTALPGPQQGTCLGTEEINEWRAALPGTVTFEVYNNDNHTVCSIQGPFDKLIRTRKICYMFRAFWETNSIAANRIMLKLKWYSEYEYHQHLRRFREVEEAETETE